VRDTLSVLQHFAVPKSEHFETAGRQLLGSRIVVALCIRVLFSVEFDDQPRPDAAEIDDEFIDRDLSAEFPAIELSVLEDRPEPLLGSRRSARERASGFFAISRGGTRSAIGRRSHVREQCEMAGDPEPSPTDRDAVGLLSREITGEVTLRRAARPNDGRGNFPRASLELIELPAIAGADR